MAKLTADRLDLDPHQVLVSSTGVIGRYLPMAAIKTGIVAIKIEIVAIKIGRGSRSRMRSTRSRSNRSPIETAEARAQLWLEHRGVPLSADPRATFA